MNFLVIFREYCDQIASVVEHARAMQSDANKQLTHLIDQQEKIQASSLPAEFFSSVQNMSFTQPCSGDLFFYEFRENSIPQQIQALKSRTNRHYQWLLVEAYEHFETFLSNAYSAAALIDPNFWPLQDYGNIRLRDLETIDYNTLLEQVRSKKGKPNSLINPIRSHFEQIRNYEVSNHLNINLFLAFHFIAGLRHKIVHSKGQIKDKDAFFKKILENAALYNNGKPDPNYLAWMNIYLPTDAPQSTISLLKINSHTIGPINFHNNIFENTVNLLLSYAHLISIQFASPEPKQGGDINFS